MNKHVLPSLQNNLFLENVTTLLISILKEYFIFYKSTIVLPYP